MTITIPSGRTLPLQAKSGGGFESTGVPAFVPMIAENFSAETSGNVNPDWVNGTFSNITAKTGSVSTELKTNPVNPPTTCGGSGDFGKRRTLPAPVPVGKTVWQRIFLYIPSAFSFGYTYSTRELVTADSNFTSGETTLTGTRTNGISELIVGDPVAVELDAGGWHITTADTGTSGNFSGTNTVVLVDPLPSSVSSGNAIRLGPYANAAACGVSKDLDGGSRNLKWFVLGPDISESTLRVYLNATCVRTSVSGGGAIERILPEANNGIDEAAPLGGVDVTFPRDQWFSLQMAVKVSSTDQSGWVRAWIDETLAVEKLNIDTISSGATALTEWGIGPYWNGRPYTDGGVGRDTFYIDDIIVASDTDGYGAPTDTDASGNIYIAPTTLVGGL